MVNYIRLWNEQEKQEDSFKLFFFINEQVVTNNQEIDNQEIDKELLRERKADINIIDSKDTTIEQNSRTTEQAKTSRFIYNEGKILRQLKK